MLVIEEVINIQIGWFEQKYYREHPDNMKVKSLQMSIHYISGFQFANIIFSSLIILNSSFVQVEIKTRMNKQYSVVWEMLLISNTLRFFL